MAISEKKINKLIKLLNARTQKANEYFLKEIGKIIKELKELSPSEAHKLIQMLRYGSKYEDIVMELSNIVKINKKEVEKIFYNYAKNDQNFYENFYKYRNKPFIPFDENTLLKRQTRALAEIASEEFRNFTRSRALGYVFKDMNGNVIFQGLRETYEKLLDEAVINIGQGKDTFNQSMKKILKEIGGSGLRTLNYESGRSIRLDSMIEMHLRSALKNLHNENQKIIAKEIDADGFEVTVHENPAPDHEDIQGYQFSIIKPSKDELSEWEKLQEGLVAKTYDGKEKQITHSKSGSYRPISEYNCYHNVQAVVLGVQKPQYSDEELEEIKKRNEKGFEYEGNHYTNYQGTQIQRLLERKIREQQDIQILAKATGDETLVIESEQKINYLLSEYQKFSDKSGLAMDTSRIYAEGYRPLKKSEMNIPEKPFKFNFPKPQKEEVKNEKLIDIKDNKFYNSSKIFKESKDHLDLTNDDNIKIYNATDKLNITFKERKGLKKAFFSRQEKSIHVPSVEKGNMKPTTILWHELGHALDCNNFKDYSSNTRTMRVAMLDYYDNNKQVPESVKMYFENMRNKAYKEYENTVSFQDYYDNYIENKRKEGYSEYNIGVIKWQKEHQQEMYIKSVTYDYTAERKKYYMKKKKEDIEYAQIGNLSDMFSAISYGKYNKDFCKEYGYHTASYFNLHSENPTTELFANFVSLKMTGCKDHLEFLQKEIPEIYKLLDELYKKIGDDLNAR